MSKVRDPRYSRFPQNKHPGGSSGIFRSLSFALPQMPRALEDQRVGRRRLAICPLSALLSPGFEYLERAVLSPPALDRDPAALRRDSLSVSGMPVQFCQLPRVQGKT
jgi:hypothetical protein